MSKFSTYPRSHIGCVVVYKHRIISSGFNSTKTHPVQKQYNIERFNADGNHTLHAEIAALAPLLERDDINFRDVSIYTYRQYKSGKLARSRPCPSCMKAIHDLGVRHIYYTSDNGYCEEVITQ